MQSRFRVNLAGVAPKVQHTRKTHTKSRDGCRTCKQRRTKCDERKPTCGKCVSGNTACEYESADRSISIRRSSTYGHSATSSPSSSSRPSPASAEAAPPNTDVYNLSLAVVRSQLDEALPSAITPKALRNLQHFQTETALTLGFSKSQGIPPFFVSQAVWRYPFLVHGVLAVTNSHLKRLYGADREAVVRYRIAEAGHWHRALQSYRKEVQRIRDQHGSSADNTDAVFATALLSVIFTFAADDEVPPDVFVASSEEGLMEVFDPLLSISGFQALIRFLPHMDIGPTWEAVLRSADDEASSFSSDEPGIEGLPAAFVRLCGLTPASSPASNVYHKLLRALTPILLLEPGRENLSKLLAYVGRVWSRARSLFTARDPLALLFLSWWLAQLRQLDLWWVTTRAKTQCRAIVSYLYSLDDPVLVPFLEYPATFGMANIDWIWK